MRITLIVFNILLPIVSYGLDGGTRVSPSKLRSYIHIPQLMCGGVRVSQNLILTAAHCVASGDGKNVLAALVPGRLLDVYDGRNGPSQDIRIVKVSIIPAYEMSLAERMRLDHDSSLSENDYIDRWNQNFRNTNDFAFIEFKGEIDAKIAHIDFESNMAGQRVVLTGAGPVEESGPGNRGNLKSAIIKTEKKEGVTLISKGKDVNGKTARTLQGDSGSPLYKVAKKGEPDTVVGLVSASCREGDTNECMFMGFDDLRKDEQTRKWLKPFIKVCSDYFDSIK